MMFRSTRSRPGERGNVFFTLFGAVAVVGVLGAGIMATMRGPLSTMVQVNRKTQAESQMEVAAKVILLESSTQPSNGDCDADNHIEPLPWKVDATTPGPDDVTGSDGGGFIPDSVGITKLDPWGTPYGYCVWDTGVTKSDAACTAQGSRIDGSGAVGEGYTVLAMISAGPDRTFQSGCLTFDNADADNSNAIDGGERMVAAAGDDIVVEKTYVDARGMGGGLWSLKSGSPSVAEIEKDIEVGGDIDLFRGGAGTGQLRLGAASMLLPDDNELGTCNAANANIMRVNDGALDDQIPILEICDPTTSSFIPAGSGAAGIGWTVNVPNIYYNTGNVGIGTATPNEALDVVGNFDLTGIADIGGNAAVGGDLNLTGDAVITGNVSLSVTSSVVWSGGSSITTPGANQIQVNVNEMGIGVAPTAGTMLRVYGASGLNVLSDGKVAIGKDTAGTPLDVGGDINLDGALQIDGNIVLNTQSTNSSTILLGKDAGAAVDMSAETYNTILGGAAGATLTTGKNNILIGAHETTAIDVPLATTNAHLNIGNTIYGDLATDKIGIGVVAPTVALDVLGAIKASSDIDGADITASGDVNAGGDVAATDNVTAGNNVTANNDVIAAGQVKSDGRDLRPPDTCTVIGQKLMWNFGGANTGWSCQLDQAGGGGGATSSGIDEVLDNGDDAGDTRNLEGLLKLGANELCNEDLTVCFTAENFAAGSGGLWTTGGADDIYYNTGTPQVGIGNAIPSQALDVTGNIQFSGALMTSGASTRIDSAGKIYADDGVEATPGYTFSADPNTGLFRPAADILSFTTGGTEKMHVDATGRLGVGIRPATSLLHVAGDVLMGNTATCDGAGANKGALKLTATDDALMICDGAGTWLPLTAEDTFATLSCNADDIVKYDGANWVCARVTDLDTLAGLAANCGTDGLVKYDGANWVCSAVNSLNIYVRVAQDKGTPIGDMTANGALAAAFDTSDAQAAAASAAATATVDKAFIGKDWGASVKRKILEVIVYPATDLKNFGGAGLTDVTLTVYGSDTAPANATDGTALGSLGPVALPNSGAQTITGLTATTAYRYHWLTVDGDSDETLYVAELYFLRDLGEDTMQSLACNADEVAAFDGTDWVCSGTAGGLWTPGADDDIYYNTGTPMVGVGLTDPNVALDVAGTLQIADGGEACDGTLAGAIKYDTGILYMCNGTAWAAVNTGAGGLWTDLTGNRIHYGSAGTEQVGVGTNDPQVALDVAGTIRVGNGAETCDGTIPGAVRYNTGTMEYCDSTAWQVLVAGSGAVGKIDDLSDASSTGNVTPWNLFLGANAGTGSGADTLYNTALGLNALDALDNASSAGGLGDFNTALGYQALTANTTGAGNVAIGYQAGDLTTTGSDNILIGNDVDAPLNTTSNYLNIGDKIKGDMTAAGVIEITGTSALALPLGTAAEQPGSPVEGMIRYNTDSNVFEGYIDDGTPAWESLVSGSGAVTAIDDLSDASSTGDATPWNLFLGANAGTGSGADTLYNTALGLNALDALDNASSAGGLGDFNTALGYQALTANTTGSNNVAIGYQAGDLTTTGDSNILIGSGVDAPLNTTSNYLNIGDKIKGDMTAAGVIEITGTSALALPLGTAAEQPGSPVEGMIRYNTDSDIFEGYVDDGTPAWEAINTGSGGLWTDLTGNRIHYGTAGTEQVGIGTNDPLVALDVDGTLRVADGGETCDGTIPGAIRYRAGIGVEYCDGTAWNAVAVSGTGVVLNITPPNKLDMDVTGPGNPASGTNVVFTVANTGNITSNALSYTLSNTTNFTVTNDTCTGNTLAAAASCVIEITPQATEDGTFYGTLSVPHHNSPSATLQGTASSFGCYVGQPAFGGIVAVCDAYGADKHLVVTPGNCTDSATPTCDGGTDTVTKKWSTESVLLGSLVQDANTGDQNTVNLIGFGRPAGYYPAAEYCTNMVYGGYSDWYLPSTDEWGSLIHPNKATIGGFSGAEYWSSYEYNSTNAFRIASSGASNAVTKSGTYRVRCARKEGVALPAAQSDTTPDAISFATKFAASAGATVSSSTENVAGISAGTAISISGDAGAKYSINGGAYTATAGTIDWGDTVAVQLTSPAAGARAQADLAIGSSTFYYSVITEGDCGSSCAGVDKRVFVTSTTYNGNLGGVAGADAKCQAAADTAAIGGTWKAMLSATSPISEWAANRVDYNWDRLVNMNGQVVADDPTDLWDGTLDNAINYDENGALANVNVRTNFEGNGFPSDTSSSAYNCQNWTITGSDDAYYGSSSSVSSTWANAGYSSSSECQDLLSLYCAEVNAPTVTLTATPNSAASMNVTGPGPTGTEVTFTIENTGSGTSAALGYSLSNALNFTVTTDTCSGNTLAPAATCTMGVTPTASADGDYNGTLTVQDSTNNVSVAIGMSGQSTGFGDTASVWDLGAGDDIYYNTGTPQVGVGLTDPLVALDVDGTLRVADGGETCDGTIPGAIKYDTGVMYMCDGTAWEAINTGAGGLWTTGAGDDIYYNTGTPMVGIGTTDPSVTLDVVGDIEYTGTLTDVSDRRLKTDIVPLIERGSLLERIDQVKGYSFRMKDDENGVVEYGVMAQELEEIFPELVRTADDEMGTKSVNYIGLIAPMIEATKELKAQNEALQLSLAEKDAAMAALNARMAVFETDVKGLKAHTEYGMRKAETGALAALMVLAAFLGGALVVFTRRRKI